MSDLSCQVGDDVSACFVSPAHKKFDIEKYLSEPPQKIEKPSIELLTNWLEHSSREESRMIILNLLREYLREHDAPALRKLMERWSKCQRWTYRRVKFFDRRIQTRCNCPLCPACSPRLAKREACRVWALLNNAPDRQLNRAYLTWVTITFGCLPIGSDFKPMANAAKKMLRNIRERLFPDTVWALELEIELQQDEQGKLHAHGFVWHPDIPRSKLAATLRRHFTGDRDVCAVPLRSNRLRTETFKAACYKADVDLSVRGWGQRTPEILARLLTSYESVRSRGRLGLRFEMGVRHKKPKGMSKTSVDILK